MLSFSEEKGAKDMKINAFLALLLLPYLLPSSQAQDELQTLLSVRSTINDPLHSLASWDASTTSFCSWKGITCSAASDHVSAVELEGKNLSGSLPAAILSLPFVAAVDLSSNAFGGAIPPDAFPRLSPSLLFLNLSNNNLSGPVYLSSDQGGGRSGSFSLHVLDLSNNCLTGPIPDEIAQFSYLKVLDLGGNYFQGRIPISLSELKSLHFLTLASNDLTGPIPAKLGEIPDLRWIYLGYNKLSGEIPQAISNLTALEHLDLVYNNLTGGIPSSIGNLRQLQYLYLYHNLLSGSLPPSVYNLTALISLDLSENEFVGRVSEDVMRLENMEVLHLFTNGFEGPIPSSLGSLPRLRVLQLWANRFQGSIPSSLGLGNDELAVVDLSSNNLTGALPEHLCFSGRLLKLIVFSNALDGRIPRDLSRCRTLERVRIENNRLSGEIPSEFTRLPSVYYLDASGNGFDGEIGRRRWEMPALRILSLSRNRFSGPLPDFFGGNAIEHLDLSENSFTDSIPAHYGKFTELSDLNLRSNRLTGPVLGSIGNLKRLVRLDLGKNHFSGHIPAGITDLAVLTSLDLSDNDFSGEIPQDLGRSGSLISINLSHNSLSGSVPSTEAFLSIEAAALEGNPGLCNGGAKSGLPPCKIASAKLPWWFSVTLLAATLLIIFLSVILTLVIRLWWRSREFELKKVETDGNGVCELRIFHKTYLTAETIFKFVKNANGEASNYSDGKGTWVIVKTVEETPGLGWAEVTELGRSAHRNVVGLSAACRSETRWVFVREPVAGAMLLSDAMKNLSWENRRRIALGVAKGLQYVHRRRLLCGALTAADDVLLGGDGEPRLVLKVANLRPGEIGERKMRDVYYLGLLLAELLTGRRRGLDGSEEGGYEEVVEWARFCYRERHLDEWIDPAMQRQVRDHRDEMIQVMGLAVRCTWAVSTERPCMEEVVKLLDRFEWKSKSLYAKVKRLVNFS